MRIPSQFCSRDESALKEATRDPIFLLLVETAQLLDYDECDRPDGWERDDDGELIIRPDGGCSCHINPPCAWCTDSRHPTFDEIVALRDEDKPICVETRVESVWLTRAECEAWIASHKYRFASDQRVRCYCVCAEGELAQVLKDGTEYSAPARSMAAENGGAS